MKKQFIKLNQPMLINNSNTLARNYQTIYGFFAPYFDDDEERNELVEDHIREYVSYLATIHEWDNNHCGCSYSLRNKGGELHWIDKTTGKEHTWDNWTREIGRTCIDKFGQGYISYIIDLDNAICECFSCGISGGWVCCKSLMDTLVTIAEDQETEESDCDLPF